MKNILLALLVAFTFVACDSNSDENKNVVAKLVVGKSLADLHLKDQFKKDHTLQADTTKLIFAFDKEPAHICNDFFKRQKATYLQNHHVQFIADVSAAPSIIRSMFIMPGIKKFKHIVLVLDDKNIAASYRKGVDATKVIVVSLLDKKITDVKTVVTTKELQKVIEAN